MKTNLFEEQLLQLTSGFTPVVDVAFEKEDYRPLDLSVGNKPLEELDTASAEAIQRYIDAFLERSEGIIAYGGYLEKRSIYDRSLYFSNADPDLKRNIHLGIDIWCPAGTAVLAPVAGIVHSFKDNRNHGDYGPCIVLEHNFENFKFYTLYGHLSRNSILTLKPGQQFDSGDTIAHLGQTEENGDYAPHLHFQIIKDLQGNDGDYPGVCTLKNVEFYKENCPDPKLLLKFI